MYCPSYTEIILLINEILGSFAKLRKVTVSVAVSVCLSVLMKQLVCHWTDFYEILYLSIFLKTVKKIQVILKPDKNNGYFTFICYVIISRSLPHRMRIFFGQAADDIISACILHAG